MNNKFVEMYCAHHSLEILKSKDVHGENHIVENNKSVGFFRDDDNLVEIGEKTYKKGDLMLFLIEEEKAH